MFQYFEKKKGSGSVDVAQQVPLREEEQAETALPNIELKNVEDISTEQPTEPDLSEALAKLSGSGDEPTAIGGIMELTRADREEDSIRNLAYKSVVAHPGSYTAAQFLADWNDDHEEGLGMPMVSEALRKICSWGYVHETARKGKRAEQAFAALKEEVNKEFTLEKEAKGLLQRG